MKTKKIIAGITAVVTMFACMTFTPSKYIGNSVDSVHAQDVTDNGINYLLFEDIHGEKKQRYQVTQEMRSHWLSLLW